MTWKDRNFLSPYSCNKTKNKLKNRIVLHSTILTWKLGCMIGGTCGSTGGPLIVTDWIPTQNIVKFSTKLPLKLERLVCFSYGLQTTNLTNWAKTGLYAHQNVIFPTLYPGAFQVNSSVSRDAFDGLERWWWVTVFCWHKMDEWNKEGRMEKGREGGSKYVCKQEGVVGWISGREWREEKERRDKSGREKRKWRKSSIDVYNLRIPVGLHRNTTCRFDPQAGSPERSQQVWDSPQHEHGWWIPKDDMIFSLLLLVRTILSVILLFLWPYPCWFAVFKEVCNTIFETNKCPVILPWNPWCH